MIFKHTPMATYNEIVAKDKFSEIFVRKFIIIKVKSFFILLPTLDIIKIITTAPPEHVVCYL